VPEIEILDYILKSLFKDIEEKNQKKYGIQDVASLVLYKTSV